jgi:preprotein translocase subunit SecE
VAPENRSRDAGQQSSSDEGPGLVTAAGAGDEAVDEDGGGGRSRRPTREGAGGEGSGGEIVHRPGPAVRLVRFLQGSWRELHRVQWPDRPQVVQATGVVIGFVIVAGAFLAGGDWIAQHLVNFILK